MRISAPLAGLMQARRLGAACLSLALASGCAGLNPATSPHPTLHSLDGAPAISTGNATGARSAPTLIVSPTRAAGGFDSRRILYVRQPGQLEYFAHNEWVDTPSRMLGPLIVAAIESGGAFRAVVRTPSPASGEMRLDTEILRLQHEFPQAPSRARFTLRAYLVESATRRVMATREFDAVVPATSEDPHGGVVAANRAVRIVLDELAAFCADAARNARLEGRTTAAPSDKRF